MQPLYYHRLTHPTTRTSKCCRNNLRKITDESKYLQVKEALAALPVKVFAGTAALSDVVKWDSVDTVLGAILGFAGLEQRSRDVGSVDYRRGAIAARPG